MAFPDAVPLNPPPIVMVDPVVPLVALLVTCRRLDGDVVPIPTPPADVMVRGGVLQLVEQLVISK
jgi:hypothetical protein